MFDAWSARYPARAASYKTIIQQTYENLHKPSGVSKEGRLAYKGQIPAELFYVIEAHHYGFFQEPGNLDKFYRIAMGKYRPKCEKNFHYVDKRKHKEYEE